MSLQNLLIARDIENTSLLLGFQHHVWWNFKTMRCPLNIYAIVKLISNILFLLSHRAQQHIKVSEIKGST